MKYFLDCEFDGFGGPLISMALVREDRESIYLVYSEKAENLWVQANVLPILWSIPSPLPGMAYRVTHREGADLIANFLSGDPNPHIITDWPDDVACFCKAVITAPGEMISLPGVSFSIVRVNAYPTKLHGAVQHNAWWDAQALKTLFGDAWT